VDKGVPNAFDSDVPGAASHYGTDDFDCGRQVAENSKAMGTKGVVAILLNRTPRTCRPARGERRSASSRGSRSSIRTDAEMPQDAVAKVES
jgi:hypothetical protein